MTHKINLAEKLALIDEAGMLLEPASTVNTGTAGGERTRKVEWI